MTMLLQQLKGMPSSKRGMWEGNLSREKWYFKGKKNTSGFSVLVRDVVFGFWKGSEVQ